MQGGGIMLKRFWNYQLLLGYSSLSFNNIKGSSEQPFYITFVYGLLYSIFFGLFVVTLSVTLGPTSILILYPIVFILFRTYSIINSQKKLFEIVPVSKVYSLINIYLYVFVMSLTITVGSTMLIILLNYVLKFSTTSNIIPFVNNWKAILVSGCIYAIVASILLPIFFIRLNFLKKFLSISAVALITITLILFTRTFHVLNEIAEINPNIIPQYNETTLLILACASIVIIPISMLISYRLYKGKRCFTC